MKGENPRIVEIPRDHKVNRFSSTYSVWESGDFWRSAVGSRKSYSTYDSAFAAVELVLFRRKYSVVYEPNVGFCVRCNSTTKQESHNELTATHQEDRKEDQKV